MRFLFLCALLTFPFIANAQDYKTILDIPPGATLVNLSATERVEIDQDLLVATLRYEAQNADPRKLQDDINGIMNAALEKAKAVSSVKVSTEQYYVYPYDYDPTPQPVQKGQLREKLQRIWRGSQGMQIKGTDAAALLKLAGELQDMGLAMGGLGYMISPDLLEKTQESLLEAALTKLKSKAERTAKGLGKTKADLLEVNVDMGGYYPQPMMARAPMADMAMAKAEMAAPVAAAGQSEITLTVSARALIRP